VVRKIARDLLHTIADGGEVSIAQVRDFANAVLASEPYRLANALLEAPRKFAVRRTLELAAFVLADDGQVSREHDAQDGGRQ
jgi:hypothetical protein